MAKVAAARQWRKLGARSRDEAKAQLVVQTLGGNYGGEGIHCGGAAVPVVQNGEGSDGVAAQWEGATGGLTARRPRRVSA